MGNSKPPEEREAYVALNMMEGVGPVTVKSLVAAFGSAGAIFAVSERELSEAPGVGKAMAERLAAQRAKINPSSEIERAAKLGVKLVTRVDPEYPEALAKIHDPPLALYVKGDLTRRDGRAISVVGTRHATIYGRDTAERLSFRLSCAGFTIVSGLARGIDTAAHRGALKAKGRTIAVTGGGIDKPYPPENFGLAEEIAASGAVATEFPIGREPDRTTFPTRNRIISGMAMGVLVVEAGAASGAMITVNQALDQGRAVFAVPGRIDSPASRGAHQLIKNGARLVEDIDDVLQEFEYLFPPDKPEKKPADIGAEPAMSDEEKAIARALEENDEMDVDSLGRETGLPPANINAVLLGMEIKRMARMLPGRRVRLGQALKRI